MNTRQLHTFIALVWKHVFLPLLMCALFLADAPQLIAQERTVGLLLRDSSACDGYTLFAPLRSKHTYLIDCDGNLIHSWEGTSTPGEAVYLLDDGSLLRTEAIYNPVFKAGGGGGRILRLSWDGDLLWSFTYRSDSVIQHHDIEPLPNGNVLLLAWELKSPQQAIAAGVPEERVPMDGLYPEHIVEVRPTSTYGGEIVWEWHLWDHLIQDADSTRENFGVVSEHPELFNINAPLTGMDPRKADWWHANSVDYNPSLDQIMISVRHHSEVWIIDHSTTTGEAASHSGGRSDMGGDLLYRFGNPRSYRPGADSLRMLHDQHDAHWIEDDLPGAGNILLFDNGETRDPRYSSVEEFTPPVDSSGSYRMDSSGVFGPTQIAWSYGHAEERRFYARYMSGAQRLPDGNTLVCNGPKGYFFEVTPTGSIVWRYVNPVTGEGPLDQGTVPPGSHWSRENLAFRCTRIPPDHPGLAGRTLESQGPIERYPSSVRHGNDAHPGAPFLHPNYPDPFRTSTTIRFTLPGRERVILRVTDVLGRTVAVLLDAERSAGTHLAHFNAASLPDGTYFCRLYTSHGVQTQRMLLLQ